MPFPPTDPPPTTATAKPPWHFASVAAASDFDTCPPDPAPKRPPVSLSSLLVCGVIVAITASIFYPLYLSARGKPGSSRCHSNMRQIANAIRMYAEDNDECLPDSARWIDQTLPYTHSLEVYHCPDASGTSFGYAYNIKASRRNLSKVDAPNALILIYDSTAQNRNAADALTSLPNPGRHFGHNTGAYENGHVGWVPDNPTHSPTAGAKRP